MVIQERKTVLCMDVQRTDLRNNKFFLPLSELTAILFHLTIVVFYCKKIDKVLQELLCGNSLALPIVTHFKFPFVVLIQENTNINILIYKTTGKWPKDFVTRYTIISNQNRQK